MFEYNPVFRFFKPLLRKGTSSYGGPVIGSGNSDSGEETELVLRRIGRMPRGMHPDQECARRQEEQRQPVFPE
ncbi:MAG: hypothetical protein BWY31_00237 [Lentisphaerae bacterium ADurb.Bin242]|nr:MAG: hypothetical protein BWY31_00237 [Lentisphaerae bacterium ADurb.Bin242]